MNKLSPFLMRYAFLLYDVLDSIRAWTSFHRFDTRESFYLFRVLPAYETSASDS